MLYPATVRHTTASALTSASLRLALRAEKRASGADLTMPPRLGFAAASVNDQFGIEILRGPAAESLPRRTEHLRHVFRN